MLKAGNIKNNLNVIQKNMSVVLLETIELINPNSFAFNNKETAIVGGPTLSLRY